MRRELVLSFGLNEVLFTDLPFKNRLSLISLITDIERQRFPESVPKIDIIFN